MFHKPDPKEQLRKNEKVFRKAEREITRERTGLEREEIKLQNDIKAAAKRGDKATATILAKQLVKLRNQKTRTYVMSSQMSSLGTQQKLMQSNMRTAEAMGSAAKAMGAANQQMNPQQVAGIMRSFEREHAQMEMKEEMLNDGLDDFLNESGDEAESDALVSQVLDEIGIEITNKVSNAPRPSGDRLESRKTADADRQLEEQLARLKAL